jgi:NAD+ kinase
VRQPEESEDPQSWAEDIFEMLATRAYLGESRWGLEASVGNREGSQDFGSYWALNDIVLGKGSLSRMIEVRVSFGDQVLIPKLRGDGLILSSPTGSTAYSLSAGGPVMDPALRALLLTPVCSHTMGLRPLVLNGDREIVLERLDENTLAMVTADGQEGMDLAMGAVVKIKMSDAPVHFLIPNSAKCQAPNYFDVLRDKLGFGRDRHAR